MGNHRGWEVGPSTATEAPEAGWGPPGKRSLPGCSAGPGLSAPHCEVRPLTRAFSSSLPALRCPRLGGRQLCLHGCGLPAKSPASHLASSGTALLAHHCCETRVPSSDGFNHKSEPAQGTVCSRRGPKNNKSRETRQRKQDEGRPKTQAREGAEPAGPRAHSRPRAGGRQHFRREQLPPSRQTQTRLCLTSQDEDVRGLLGGRPPPVDGCADLLPARHQGAAETRTLRHLRSHCLAAFPGRPGLAWCTTWGLDAFPVSPHGRTRGLSSHPELRAPRAVPAINHIQTRTSVPLLQWGYMTGSRRPRRRHR